VLLTRLPRFYKIFYNGRDNEATEEEHGSLYPIDDYDVAAQKLWDRKLGR
jgi:hypothetical protein